MGNAAEPLRSGTWAKHHHLTISLQFVDCSLVILGLDFEKCSIREFKCKRILQQKLGKDQAVDFGFHMLQLYYIRELRYYEYI